MASTKLLVQGIVYNPNSETVPNAKVEVYKSRFWPWTPKQTEETNDKGEFSFDVTDEKLFPDGRYSLHITKGPQYEVYKGFSINRKSEPIEPSQKIKVQLLHYPLSRWSGILFTIFCILLFAWSVCKYFCLHSQYGNDPEKDYATLYLQKANQEVCLDSLDWVKRYSKTTCDSFSIEGHYTNYCPLILDSTYATYGTLKAFESVYNKSKNKLNIDTLLQAPTIENFFNQTYASSNFAILRSNLHSLSDAFKIEPIVAIHDQQCPNYTPPKTSTSQNSTATSVESQEKDPKCYLKNGLSNYHVWDSGILKYLEILFWAFFATLIRMIIYNGNDIYKGVFRAWRPARQIPFIFCVPVLALLISFILSVINFSVGGDAFYIKINLDNIYVAIIISSLIAFSPWRAWFYLQDLSEQFFRWLSSLVVKDGVAQGGNEN